MDLKNLAAGCAVCVAAILPPGQAFAASPFQGIVVTHQHGMMLVASPQGIVRAVPGHAAIGSRLAGSRIVGHAKQARIHGIVIKTSARHSLSPAIGIYSRSIDYVCSPQRRRPTRRQGRL
jgi:hypothetical protein